MRTLLPPLLPLTSSLILLLILLTTAIPNLNSPKAPSMRYKHGLATSCVSAPQLAKGNSNNHIHGNGNGNSNSHGKSHSNSHNSSK